MKSGDLVTVALAGDFGKPRPGVVVQSNRFLESETVIVLLITTTIGDAPFLRITVEPTEENGLRHRSQVMVDKVMTVRRGKVGKQFGQLDSETMGSITRSLALLFGFA